MVVLAATVLAEKTSAWGHRVSLVVGAAALALAVAVVFEPGIAPGLHDVARSGLTGGM
jgi:hypothetical protein